MTGPLGVRCDRCGLPDDGPFSFCPRCSLYVCLRCWDAAGGACLGCLHPGLPVGGGLAPAIRGTLAAPRPPHAPPSTSRVGRSLAARDRRLPASPSSPSARATPAVSGPSGRRRPHRSRLRIAGGILLRVATAAVAAALALTVLPAFLGQRVAEAPTPSPAPSLALESVAPTPPGGAAVSRHVVRAGETLRSISLQVYGTEEGWELIYAANRAVIDDPDWLRVGTELVIPPRE